MSGDGKRGRWVGLTWVLFALLIFASSTLLVFGCKIAFLPGRGYCPAPVDRSDLEREIARREALEQKVHDAEINVARIAGCATPPPTPIPAATPTPPVAPPHHAEGPTIGKSGRMQITLWWHTVDDIDLHLQCNPPGTELSPESPASRGPGLCGDGTLDVDANRNMVSPTTSPAEHIYWKQDIPAVSYVVTVRPFKTHSGDKIPYSVRVEYDGEEKVCSGDVSWDGRVRTGHSQVALIFTPSHPLPDCALTVLPINNPCQPGQQHCGEDKP
jgi:hypothetical protein